MNPKHIKLLIPIILITLFNLFFWQEKLGLNLVLFGLLLIGTMFYLFRPSFAQRNVQITLGGSLISLAIVLIYNTLLAKIGFFVSLALLTAFVHQNQIRSVFFALAYSFCALMFTIPNVFMAVYEMPQHWGEQRTRWQKTRRFLGLAFVPILVFWLFFFIFKAANPIFNSMTDHLGLEIGQQLARFFSQFSALRFWFVVWGSWLIISALFNWNLQSLVKEEQNLSDNLVRKRVKPILLLKNLALLNEYRMGIILMVMLNVLLLTVNTIDFWWLWVGFDYQQVKNFSELVHNGTDMLIFSILLSMAIILYFFKGNLNFLSKNQSLKFWAYGWILQNAFLTLSVALRNYYYIHEHGWAYGRIGVWVFLSLVLVGLFTVYQKLKSCKSIYYLLRVNSWAAYCLLILASLVDWDVLIVRQNLQMAMQKKEIDMVYLINLSDRTLAILDEYKHKVNYFKADSPYPERYGEYYGLEGFKQRIARFKNEQKNYSWLSWNYADYQVITYFKKHK
jgi:hypothetical protein